MSISDRTQAILLLTSYFTRSSDEPAKPLTISEWKIFSTWLRDRNIFPENLLDKKEADNILKDWKHLKISCDRIQKLLNRKYSFSIAMEKWQKANIWVLTRSDKDYPSSLKEKLGQNSPPVLFCCGERSLLKYDKGIAVVGSRKADEDNLQFSKRLGERATKENITIISGGARGVDEEAMFGAIESGGKAIGVLAESLFKNSVSKKWREALSEKKVLLMSPFYPESSFHTGNAMGRNKYIYCLSDAAVVVHSGKTGGTITGAIENLKKPWVPIWVQKVNDKNAGNEKIVQAGGEWYTDSESLKDLFTYKPSQGRLL